MYKFKLFLQIALIFYITSCTFSKQLKDSEEEEEAYIEEGESKQENEVIEYADEEEDEVIYEGEEDERETAVAMDEEGSDQTEEETTSYIESSYDEDIPSYITNPEEEEEEEETVEKPKKKKWVPIKKIPKMPWQKDGKWMNSVYIARAGDTLDSISSKIYDSTNSVELRSWNSHLKNREPKVGEKIYYNSPKRPNDQSSFLNFYEDNGETPESYDIQSGENIRTVSTQLLGHPDSWKEIWATNFNIESKGQIDQTTTIQYWVGKKDYVIPKTSVEPSPVDGPVVDEPVVDEPSPAVEPPPEPPKEADPFDDPFAAEPEPLELEKEDSAPPPPAIDQEQPSDNKTGLDVKKMILIGVVVLIFALLLAQVIRKRRERAEFDFSKTNIDIDSIEE